MEASQLPQDLIAEIFLRLPVRSLLRFKCLSKSFFALIESFGFINTHLIRSSQALNLRKMIIKKPSSMTCHVLDVNPNAKVPIPYCLGKPVSFPWNRVYGECKGLILLSQSRPHDTPRLALWNPSTRRSKILPECPCFVPADAHFRGTIGAGLGYDESRDEYKALYMVEVEEKGGRKSECWVYGLKSICWRRIWDFPYRIRVYSMGDFADGCVHCLSKPSVRNQTEILAFDVSKESFSLVPQPIKLTSGLLKLHVLGDSLCISYFSQFPVPQAELYVRNKRGGGFSWTQIYSVGQQLFDNLSVWNFKVLGYLEGRKKILLQIGICMVNLLSYDLKTQSFDKVEIKNTGDWRILLLCQESLASVE